MFKLQGGLTANVKLHFFKTLIGAKCGDPTCLAQDKYRLLSLSFVLQKLARKAAQIDMKAIVDAVQ